MSASSPHVAVAGATGAVGAEMLKCLEQRDFPVGKLTLLASARSAGRKLVFRGEEIAVQLGVGVATARRELKAARLWVGHRMKAAAV